MNKSQFLKLVYQYNGYCATLGNFPKHILEPNLSSWQFLQKLIILLVTKKNYWTLDVDKNITCLETFLEAVFLNSKHGEFGKTNPFLTTRKTPGFARLCSRSRYSVRFVGDHKIFDKFVLSWFHGRYFCRYIIAELTLKGDSAGYNDKTGEYYAIIRFLSENSGFLPGIRIFPEFFASFNPEDDLRTPEIQTLSKSVENCRPEVGKRQKNRFFFRNPDFSGFFFRPKPGQLHEDSGNLNFIKICWELAEEIANTQTYIHTQRRNLYINDFAFERT